MADPPTPPFLDAMRPQATGNVLVTFEGEGSEVPLRILERAMARSPGPARAAAPRCVECEELGAIDAAAEDGPLLLGDYGLAVIPRAVASRDIAQVLAAESGVAEARPEFYMFALDAGGGGAADDALRTWGVAATGAQDSPLTGAGVRLAVLDTGLDAGHPDLARAERSWRAASWQGRAPTTSRDTAPTARARRRVRPRPSGGRATAWRQRRPSTSARCSATTAWAARATSSPAWPGRWSAAAR